MQHERWMANIAWEVMELAFATSFGRNSSAWTEAVYTSMSKVHNLQQ